MIKALAHRWLQRLSARYQYDTGYMAELLDHSPGAFLKYALINIPSTHRRGIPPAPWYAARIRAALREDCGPCVQLVCNMALEAGVQPDSIAAILACDLTALDEDIALALAFTEHVLDRDPAANDLRAEVRRRWGEDGLVSLALTIATTRVYPGVKYALGHGQACSRVEIARRGVTPVAMRSATLAQTATEGV